MAHAIPVIPIELTRPEIERRLAQAKLSLAVVVLSNLESAKQLHTLTLTRSRRQLWVAHNHAFASAGGLLA